MSEDWKAHPFVKVLKPIAKPVVYGCVASAAAAFVAWLLGVLPLWPAVVLAAVGFSLPSVVGLLLGVFVVGPKLRRDT